MFQLIAKAARLGSRLIQGDGILGKTPDMETNYMIRLASNQDSVPVESINSIP